MGNPHQGELHNPSTLLSRPVPGILFNALSSLAIVGPVIGLCCGRIEYSQIRLTQAPVLILSATFDTGEPVFNLSKFACCRN